MSNLLVEGARVLGMTRPDDVTPDGALLVEDGAIVALHAEARKRGAEALAAGRRLERIDARGLWLIPGFVQTHIHLCQTLLRNGPDDLPLLPWLKSYVWPGEAAHDEATLEISARLGLAELLAGGTTALLDMGTVRHTDAIFRAAEASGMRVTSGNVLMDDASTNPEDLLLGATESLAETERLAKRWHGAAGGRLAVAYCPRFAVSCTDALLRTVAAGARSSGFLVHTHASESADEVALVMARTGKRNVTYLDDVGISGSHVVLAHVIHTDQDERALLAARGTTVAHCPSSNLKLASGICPVPEYLSQGIRVTLGADGAPCNDRLDPFTEMRLAALLPKARPGAGALSAWDVVRMATRDGAAALGLPAGTLETGRRADFVLLDPDSGFASPTSWRDDPYGPIVYSMDRSHVVATYVEGVPRYRRGEPFPLKPTANEIGAAVAALKRRRSGGDSRKR
ncbi:MAG TPA: amidohydrolase family protein [Thermoanaerobaculia bacterium]|jgi:cytosine/adenosine deaminase-related metal-dependent hydrolase